MRRFALLLLGTFFVLAPSTTEAKQVRYIQNVWNEATLTDSVEATYDGLMNYASSLAGAPDNGRALEVYNSGALDTPSNFERNYKRTNKPMIKAYSSHDIAYTPLYNTKETPRIILQNAPGSYQ